MSTDIHISSLLRISSGNSVLEQQAADYIDNLERTLATKDATIAAGLVENAKALGTAEQLLEEECKDGDRICKALGVERTAGGRMNIRGLLNAIKRRQHGKGEGCWCIPTEVGNGIFEHRQAITYWVIEKETSPVQYLSWGAKWFWSDDFSLANRWDEKHDAAPYIESHGGVVHEHMNMEQPK